MTDKLKKGDRVKLDGDQGLVEKITKGEYGVSVKWDDGSVEKCRREELELVAREEARATFMTLHCEAGDHDYDWKVKRGRRPINCEAHKPKPEQGERAASSPATLSAAIRQALELPAAATCRCGLSEATTAAELRALGAGCTAPYFVCSTLSSVRRFAKT